MNKIKHIVLMCLTCLLISCSCYSLDSVPYVMTGEFVMEEGAADYSICGVDLYLFNKSDKDIKRIYLVFFLFDKDGEPAMECSNKIYAVIEKEVFAGETENFCMSLDSFMNSVPEDYLIIDYLYLSKIEYEDGTVWEDPYGLIAFK